MDTYRPSLTKGSVSPPNLISEGGHRQTLTPRNGWLASVGITGWLASEYADKGDINENIISHDLYYELLTSCHFCLPLISQNDLSYHVDRMTSAIATAIGLEKPFIMDRTTAATYGIEGIIYQSSLVDLLSLMSNLDQNEYSRMAKNAQLMRDREMVFGNTSWERALNFLDIIRI